MKNSRSCALIVAVVCLLSSTVTSTRHTGHGRICGAGDHAKLRHKPRHRYFAPISDTGFKPSSTRSKFYAHSRFNYEPSLFGEIVIDTSTGEFKDAFNRTIIFHGINLVAKGFPWYPTELLNTTYLENLRKWGFNVVRLGTMWPGFQPIDEHSFNETFISIFHQIVNNLNEYGIYPLFDMHQDVISSLYGSYDGVPQWLFSHFTPPEYPYPWPLSLPLKSWAEGYITQAVSIAFQHLYSNSSGSLTYWSRFWQRVAKEFGSNRNTLGYELINEPWAGDIYGQPGLIVPGVAGSRNLAPVYDVLAKAIREIDNRSLIFYEPVTWGIFSSTLEGGTGFSKVPGGDDYRNRSVLSYHYYCWILSDADQGKAYPHYKKLICDDILLQQVLPTILKSVRRTGGGQFLTEFGLCTPTSQFNWTGTVECATILQKSDEYKQSWANWDAAFYDTQGNVLVDSVRYFARVYPRATAGILHTFHFDPLDSTFSMNYSHDTSILQPTVVFVPELHYPKGQFLVRLSTEPAKALTWTYDLKNTVLYITVANAARFRYKYINAIVEIIPCNF